MKGVIVNCLKQTVEKQFGADRWTTVVEEARAQAAANPSPISDVDDATVLALLQGTCKVLGITLEQAGDAFGEHWVCTYAAENYPFILGRFKSAREMLLGMDRVHRETTASVKNARPPRFDFRWLGDKTLVMTYHSPRNLADLVVGLARGVGKHFGEHLSVRKLSTMEIEIVFP